MEEDNKTKLARVQVIVVANGYQVTSRPPEFAAQYIADEFVFESFEGMVEFLKKELLVPPLKKKVEFIDESTGANNWTSNTLPKKR